MNYKEIIAAGLNTLDEATKKIACLECDEVSTEKAWKKNRGTCPKCKTSTRGVAESMDEEKIPDKDEHTPGDRVGIRKNVTKYGGMGGTIRQVKNSSVMVKIDDGPDKSIEFAKSEIILDT